METPTKKQKVRKINECFNQVKINSELLAYLMTWLSTTSCIIRITFCADFSMDSDFANSIYSQPTEYKELRCSYQYSILETRSSGFPASYRFFSESAYSDVEDSSLSAMTGTIPCDLYPHLSSRSCTFSVGHCIAWQYW